MGLIPALGVSRGSVAVTESRRPCAVVDTTCAELMPPNLEVSVPVWTRPSGSS